jgi:hypothetical protein
MSANSLLASQAFPVSGVDTAGAAARVSGDSANVLSASDLSLVQKGGKRRKSSKKSRKSSKTARKSSKKARKTSRRSSRK